MLLFKINKPKYLKESTVSIKTLSYLIPSKQLHNIAFVLSILIARPLAVQKPRKYKNNFYSCSVLFAKITQSSANNNTLNCIKARLKRSESLFASYYYSRKVVTRSKKRLKNKGQALQPYITPLFIKEEQF